MSWFIHFSAVSKFHDGVCCVLAAVLVIVQKKKPSTDNQSCTYVVSHAVYKKLFIGVRRCVKDELYKEWACALDY